MLVAVLATAGIRAGVAADGEPPVPLAASEDGVAIAQDTDCADMQVIDCCRCDPVCRVRANALWMRLSRPNDAVLVTDFTPGGVVLLNASEFKFGAECGPEIAIVRQINDDWNLEGRFFRIDGWNATRGVVDDLESDVQYATPFRIGVPSPHPIILDTTIAGSYRSELTDVEINGRRRINDFWSLLLGFRYLGLDEGLTIQQGVNFGFATFTHNIRAVNDLYGLQIGADMNIWSRGRLSIEGLVKAGVYGDHAVNRTHIGLTNSAYSADSSASADRAAFAGEMSITGVYRLGKHLSLRGGYQYLWLAGVARASDQVAVSDPLAGTAAVSFKGSPSYDGAFVGLEFAR
jgi:hypothetical protein